MKGIDVAKWNHEQIEKTKELIDFDWKKVKDSGVQFVIAKVINKQCKIEDSFLMNYAGATEQGIPVDVYNYSYATNTQKAISDANIVLSVIRGKNIKRVWLDVEDKIQMNLGMSLIDIIKSYKQVIELAGYEFGVYTGLSFYNTLIKPYHDFLNCDFWIARYPSNAVADLSFEPPVDKKPNIIHPLCGWQYSSSGRINGIQGNVDLNIWYEKDIDSTSKKPVLKKGSNGKYVAYLQQRLCEKGYDAGKIDGDFGNNTLLTVKTFQADNKLVVDGVVGEKTWELLETEVKAKIREFSLKADENKKISPNFSVKEFRCKDGSDKILIDVDFVQNKLQAIRDHFGVPVTINSAYRTNAYNTRVGGAKNSYHKKGQAFDIVVKGKTPLQVAQCAQKLEIPGIIQYNTFVHVDSREKRYWARNDNGKVTVRQSF